MNNTTEATEGSVGSKYQGYRILTLLVPLNAPTTTKGKKKNMKLHHIMRMFVYTLRQRTGYHRIAPQADTRLRYGALCVQWKRQMKLEHVLESAEVQRVLERLQTEAICPFAQLFDDDGTGDAPPPAHAPLQRPRHKIKTAANQCCNPAERRVYGPRPCAHLRPANLVRRSKQPVPQTLPRGLRDSLRRFMTNPLTPENERTLRHRTTGIHQKYDLTANSYCSMNILLNEEILFCS